MHVKLRHVLMPAVRTATSRYTLAALHRLYHVMGCLQRHFRTDSRRSHCAGRDVVDL